MPILLKDLLQHYKSLMLGSTPAALVSQLAREEQVRRDTDWFRAAIRTGDRAPDIRLPDSGAFGHPAQRLSDLLPAGPILLKFTRGRWCPFCTLELKAYEKIMPGLCESGVRMIVISGESGESLQPGQECGSSGFSVIWDPELKIARAFGLAYTPGPAEAEICRRLGCELPVGIVGQPAALTLPALYLVGTDGLVWYANVPGDMSVREEPAQVLLRVQETCGLV